LSTNNAFLQHSYAMHDTAIAFLSVCRAIARLPKIRRHPVIEHRRRESRH